jgi:prepilin-type N-terminal cleavage/methylation domain-containing protein
MLKSKNKRGYTLIEVVCALTVLSILLLAAMSIELNYFSAKKYNKALITSTHFMEALKNNIMDKYSYVQINNLVTNKNYYISKEKMSLDRLKETSFISNLLVQAPLEVVNLEKPYVVIRKESGDGRCINIKLTAYIQNNSSTETLQMEFLKGDY